MAYAKLVFPAETFVLRKLKEVVRFATGQISSVSNLEFADQSLSEIVITDAPGWSLQAQSFESSGTATISDYRLTAPCVNTSKYKNLRIRTTASGDRVSGHFTTQTPWNTAPSSTSTTGYGVFIMGSSWTSTTLNNSTWQITAAGSAANVGLPENVGVPYFNMNGTTIHVFSSQRKLIVFSGDGALKLTYASMLEFPETQHTIKHSNIPCLVSTTKYAHSDSPYKVTATGVTPGGTGSTDTYNYFYQHFFTDWYSPSLGTRTVRAIWDYGTNNVEYFSTPTLNITSAGQTAYPLIPMTDIRTIYGEGIHNYSTLTDMYITYRESAYVGHGDTIDVNGTDYVIMQVGDSAANYRAFAIKKG